MDLSANCWILTLRIPILECAQHKPDTFSFPQFVNLAISGRNRRVLLLSSHVPVLEHTQYLPTTVFGDSDLPKWCTDEKLHVGEGRLCRWDGPATSFSLLWAWAYISSLRRVFMSSDGNMAFFPAADVCKQGCEARVNFLQRVFDIYPAADFCKQGCEARVNLLQRVFRHLPRCRFLQAGL